MNVNEKCESFLFDVLKKNLDCKVFSGIAPNDKDIAYPYVSFFASIGVVRKAITGDPKSNTFWTEFDVAVKVWSIREHADEVFDKVINILDGITNTDFVQSVILESTRTDTEEENNMIYYCRTANFQIRIL